MGLRRAVFRLAGGILAGYVWLAAGPVTDVLAQDASGTETARTSFEVLSQRALAGDPKAACDVGIALINGDSVPQNFTAGLHWLFLSSAQGFGYAYFVLADLYSRGYAGLPVSDEQTYAYASLAVASAALPESYRRRALRLRSQAAGRLTPARLAAIQSSLVGTVCDAAPGLP